jgi:Flp pilus assembly protein TadB
MDLSEWFLKLGYFLIASGLLGVVFYFIDVKVSFSFHKFRIGMADRITEIRGIFEENKNNQQDQVQKIILQYNQDIRIGLLDYVKMTLNQSGIRLTFVQFLGGSFFLTLLGMFLGISLNNIWLSVLIPVAFSQILFLVVRFRFALKQASYRNSSGGVIQEIYSDYRTSKELIYSIQLSVDSMSSPFKELFQQFLNDIQPKQDDLRRVTMPFDAAVDRMMHQVLDPTFRLFCSLLKVSHRMGIVIVDEMKSIKELYDDEIEVRYELANEMHKEKIESILLASFPIVAQVLGFVLFPNEFKSLLQVPWINSMLGLADTLLIFGIFMLPSIFSLDTE